MPGFFDEAGSPAQVADVSTNNASADFARANAANSGSFATPGIFDRLFGKKKPKNHVAVSSPAPPEALPVAAPLPQSPKPAISSGPSLIKRLVDQASGPARYNAQGVALVPGTPMTPEEFTKALGNSFMQAMPQLPQQPFGMPGGPTPGPGNPQEFPMNPSMPFNPMQMGQMPPLRQPPPNWNLPASQASPWWPNRARGASAFGQPQMSGGGYFARGGYPHMVGYPMPPEPMLPQRHFARGGEDYIPDRGHGNGRSDHVDAKLSPGEFIQDAETTSLLGDGDNEAGARGWEAIRQTIRREKGAALAKGKFSPDAKSPQHYAKVGMRAAKAKT